MSPDQPRDAQPASPDNGSTATATATVPAESPENAAARRTGLSQPFLSLFLRYLLRNSLLLILVVIAIGFAATNAKFASLENVRTILTQVAALALISFGETFVILTAGIDLSVGSIVGFSGVISALALVHHYSFMVAMVAAAVAGIAVGIVNGLLVAYVRITPFIVTLGTLYAALSAGYILSNGQPVSSANGEFLGFAINSVAGVPVVAWITLGLFLILWLILSRTNYGTHIYAVGGNQTAARLAGINVRGVIFSAYTISGLLAGIAGVMLASQSTSGIATTGNGYELTAIAASVIGGVSLFGGRGRIWGTLIGIVMITMLTDGLDVLNVSPFYQDLVEGTLIIAAVFADGLYARVYGEH